MAQMQIFLSHSSKDKAFADQLVAALRGAGADVWYDEHNLGAGVLRREINDQLAKRPVVIVVISKAALTSQWVQDECEWAYNLYRRKPERLILPVVAAPYDMDDFDHVLFLESLKRVEAPGNQPFSVAEAVARTLRLLELTPAGQQPTPVAPPQPSESIDDLLAKGKALAAQNKDTDAIPFFKRASEIDPHNFDAWANLGRLYLYLQQDQRAVDALDRALAVNAADPVTWYYRSQALFGMKRFEEALKSIDRALALNMEAVEAPRFWASRHLPWYQRALICEALQRYEEALAAYERHLASDPHFAHDFGMLLAKGRVLNNLKRYKEALVAIEDASRYLPLDYAGYNDAPNAPDFAPKHAAYLQARAIALRGLGRKREADQAERRAKELGG